MNLEHIQIWPIDRLKNWERNPRSINKDRYEELKRSIKELGFNDVLKITKDGTVIGGNMRLRALEELGFKEVPVLLVEADDDSAIFRVALRDNEEFGYYEQEQVAELALELGLTPLELKSYALALGQLTTLDLIVDKFGPEPEEDEVPEVDDANPPVSKLGEVYQLGRHRLMCGDATKAEDVEHLMDGAKADMVFTDPPYNTGMTEKTPGKLQKSGSTWLSHMFDDAYTDEEFHALLVQALGNMYSVTKGEAAFYVCIDWRSVDIVKGELSALMPVSNVIVWDKVVHGLGSDYKYTYELIVVGKKGNPKIHNRIGSDYQDVWHVQRRVGHNDDHATAKPVELVEKPIKHASRQDDIVLDLFGGSGSTLIAAEQTDRICYMMELDPKYCDVIRKRYAKVKGEEEQWQSITAPVAPPAEHPKS